ncbi:VrrA/YqfQ family protein [Thalassobacillus sp. CUG 92003]|uniref:VrrA/YqfQ family protein n=1 Tax=Thalassobacillus sp. CUG 92003 TaxID=2736641 RepID=UPI0015E6C7CB|nr:VrrA/YqfQ family protein [Thalassobacillus sp. CUG 92003]
MFPPPNQFRQFPPAQGYGFGPYAQAGPKQGLSGLIGRIFGGQSGGQSFPGAGGFGPGFGGPFTPYAGANTGGGWLSNIENIVKMAKTAAPYIEQYGPYVKNVPAMINLMKIMNEPDEDDEDNASSSESSNDTQNKSYHASSEEESSSIQEEPRRRGTSEPKLFFN